MRLPLFSLGMLLALSLIVTGCNKDSTETPAANGNTSNINTPIPRDIKITVTGETSHPSQKTVMQFLPALLDGNTKGTVALLTPLAQAEFAKNSFYLNSLKSFQSNEFQDVKFRLTGSDLVSENDPNYFGVYVDVIINDDEPTPSVWLVRKIGDEYRVAGMMFFDDEVKQNIAIDFEGQVNSDGTPVQQQALTNQMPTSNQPMMQPNPQAVQQFPQQPQFDTPIFQQPQPNMNPQQQQMAQPNTPIFQ